MDNSSPSDSDTGVTQSFNTSVSFSEIMDKTTITINTSDTSCSSGTFQFSADNFDTCLKNTGVTFTVSNSDKTFTATIGFATSTTYKFRITSGATDLADPTNLDFWKTSSSSPARIIGSNESM